MVDDKFEFNRKKFGKLIQKARKELGMSQKELANQLHISDKTISSYEVGRALPGFDVLKMMGNVLNKPITYFDADYIGDLEDMQVKLDRIGNQISDIKGILARKN